MTTRRAHQIGRRGWLAAAVALSIVAASCGGDDEGSDAGGDSTEVPGTGAPGDTETDATAVTDGADTPDAEAPGGEPSGSLRAAYPVGAAGLDPHKQSLIIDPVYTFLLYDRLFQIDSTTFEVEPMLATEWAFSADNKTLELTLRDDVMFNDGTPFDAEAVKANLERQLTDETVTTKPLVASVESVEVVDEFVVALHLSEGGGELLANLATHAGAMISPAALADPARDLSTDPGEAGSGAYLLTEYDPTTSFLYENAPGDYWDPEAGRLEQLEIVVMNTTVARLTAVRTGEVDLAHLQLPEALEAVELAEQGEFEVFRVDNFLSGHDVIFDTEQPGLDDARVRQALVHAIDREGISAGLLSGGCLVTNQLYPDSHWAASDSLADYQFDPDRARELLAEAGVSDLSVSIGYATGTPFELLATAIAQQWEDVGVTVELAGYATNAEANAAWLAGEFSVYQSSIVGSPDPDTTIKNYFLGGFDLIRDPEQRAAVEGLVAEAVDPSLDLDGRAAVYGEIWTNFAEQVYSAKLCRTFQTYAYADRVSGVDDMGLVYSGFFDGRSLSVSD